MSSPRSPRRRKLVIGVCAMDAKTRSRPMRAILERLLAPGDFECVMFGDKTILDEPVSCWPPCDFLIAFHSRGFPLEKAVEYAQQRGVFCVNDLPLQRLLLDRRMVLAVLDAIDVPTPRRVWTTVHGGPPVPAEMHEPVSRDFAINFGGGLWTERRGAEHLADGRVRVGGREIGRPFVEKPVDAEDHNISIYLAPRGSGCRRLFRKVGNRASELDRDDTRLSPTTEHDFVYEEHLEPDNAEDVKVYTVGPGYVHAECRKAPAVDGRVERNAEGKEVRRVTVLTAEEEEIARRVCMAFGQTVCGFDLVRCGGRPYVIDVNGWSFVKGNDGYYDRCARILRDTFLRVARRVRLVPGILTSVGEGEERGEWRLAAYLSVYRHADRTPKQKYRVELPVTAFGDYMVGEGDVLVDLQGGTALRDLLHRLAPLPEAAVLCDILRRNLRTPGIKVQLVRRARSQDVIQLSAKWGGEFTHAGRHQSKEAGESLRTDLALLTAPHTPPSAWNTVIRASRERRVVGTAGVFGKALLGTAELPNDAVRVDIDGPPVGEVLRGKVLLEAVKAGHRQRLETDLAGVVKELGEYARAFLAALSANIDAVTKAQSDQRWCCSDTPRLFRERWERLLTTILAPDPAPLAPDPSHLFELYDSIKYDLLHHRRFLSAVIPPAVLEGLVGRVEYLFGELARTQYGRDGAERLEIARCQSAHILRMIGEDLGVVHRAPPGLFLRFYFTKESHLNTLSHLLHTAVGQTAAAVGELDYLGQVDMEVFRRRQSADGAVEWAVRLGVRQGAHADSLLDLQMEERGLGSSSSSSHGPRVGRHVLALSQKRHVGEYVDLGRAIDGINRLLQ